MAHRIEIAEVLSFRLAVAQGALAALVDELSAELSLVLESDSDDLILRDLSGDSYLRFRIEGGQAILNEVALCNDNRGLFYERVLRRLLTDGRGDFHARLVWNDSDRNTHGHFSEVVWSSGKPAAALLPARALKNSLIAPTPEEPKDEIDELLNKARSHWEEYQRLKRAKSPSPPIAGEG